jgi:hypothetical protein
MVRQGQGEKMNKERERNMAIMRETEIKINCKKKKKAGVHNKQTKIEKSFEKGIKEVRKILG